MRRMEFNVVVLLAALLITPCAFAQNNLPLLEQYSFMFGDSGVTEFLFHDGSIGNGAAQLRLHVSRRSTPQWDIRIEVFRHQRAGTISFALLLERVELTLTDSGGTVVKRIALDEILGPDGLFIIGDSSDGYFQHTAPLGDISRARSMELRLLGNYE